MSINEIMSKGRSENTTDSRNCLQLDSGYNFIIKL